MYSTTETLLNSFIDYFYLLHTHSHHVVTKPDTHTHTHALPVSQTDGITPHVYSGPCVLILVSFPYKESKTRPL